MLSNRFICCERIHREASHVKSQFILLGQLGFSDNNLTKKTYGKLPLFLFLVPASSFLLSAFTITNTLISDPNLSLQRLKESICGCCISASECSHRSVHITSARSRRTWLHCFPSFQCSVLLLLKYICISHRFGTGHSVRRLGLEISSK